MTDNEIGRIFGRLDKNDADHVTLFHKMDEVMGEVREVTKTVGNWRVWRARVEGMVSGSRWTLVAIGLAVGVLTGGGLQVLIGLK
jgi:hypothetical protein